MTTLSNIVANKTINHTNETKIDMKREYTGFKTDCGSNIFVGDTLKVVLRNNVEFTGQVIKDGKDFCVDIGRKLIISKCFKDGYNTGLDTYHKKCGWRYAAFYTLQQHNKT